ncbi:MAG: phosphopentomutase [Wenzhouxiangella sp.]|nr:phosphopentomutase [Wenzhouxiangella sp.]
MPRAIVLVLDSLGIGASADAARFGDSGADTLGQVARSRAGQGGLHIPNLGSMGLVHAHHASTGYRLKELPLPSRVEAAWGYAREQSTGKDTPSGHWEMAGVPVRFDFGYFRERENSFPESLLRELIERAGLPGVLGNCHASGTEIIDRLGAEHLATGKPIVYTSADSVFQVAAHEQQFGLERLDQGCQIARDLLMPFNIGRVIARPFTGTIETGFVRTGQRRDYSLMPPAPTVLDKLVDSGGEVLAVGKIADIYAHSGISREIKADGNEALFDATLAALEGAGERSLVMTNFVDFDMLYGHRRDARGYADALEAFDRRLPELLAVLDDNDLLVLTADHGCDPSFPGSDHTREHVPVLARGAGLTAAALGARSSFADIGQSIAAHLELPPMADGRSFLP